MYSLLRDLLVGVWAIAPEGIATYQNAAMLLLSGKGGELQPRAGYMLPKKKTAKPRKNASTEYCITQLFIEGVITKDDRACEGFGTRQLAEQFRSAETDSDGIMLMIDSPGGQVSGTDTFAKVIAQSTVPVLAYIDDGMMASAAYWLGSQATEIWSSNLHNIVGSIGVMASFADLKGYWEKMGIQMHEVYSSLSPEKNSDFAEALKGNYEPIQKNTLDKIAMDFHNAVKSGRGKKLNLETLKGASYTSDKALAMGLIDRIGSEAEALTRLAQIIEERKKATQTSTATAFYQFQTDMKVTPRWSSLLSLIGFAQVDAEAGKITMNGAEADLLNEKLTNLQAQLDSVIEERDSLTAELQTAHQQVASLQNEVSSLKAKIAAMPAAQITVVTADSDISSAKGFPVDPEVAHFARLAKSKVGRK